jgi:DNA-binding NarL/FixJ family response regulator
MRLSSTTMPSDIAVAVIDDHDVIHAGIAIWCRQANPPIRIAGNYLSVESFLSDDPPQSTDVDVVLVDLELKSRHLDLLGVEKVIMAGHRVVVFSHIDADEIILKCLDLGVMSYVVKTEGKNHLIDAIRDAYSDIPYVAPRMAGAMFNDRRVGRPNLPVREEEVLIAWFQTESKDLVAEKLHIAPSTVRTHLQRVRAKYAALGRPASTKAALVARAIQDGIINLDDL